jgi:predicted HNH restriction endonuclease
MKNENQTQNEITKDAIERVVSSDSKNFPMEFRWRTEDWHNDNTETMDDFLDHEMPDNWTEMESQRDGTYAEAMVNNHETLLRLDASGDGDPYNHLVVASIIF